MIKQMAIQNAIQISVVVWSLCWLLPFSGLLLLKVFEYEYKITFIYKNKWLENLIGILVKKITNPF